MYCPISLHRVSWKGGGSDESGSFIVRGVAGDRYDFTRSGTNPRTARGAAVGGGWIQFSWRARGFENSPQYVALDWLIGERPAAVIGHGETRDVRQKRNFYVQA